MKLIMEKFRKNVVNESAVPDDDAYSALDTEKYPIQPDERLVDEVFTLLERFWVRKNKAMLSRADEGKILDLVRSVVDEVMMIEPQEK